MNGDRRIRLTEGDGMERGIRCPDCGAYASFGYVLATGRCPGDCGARLSLELVVR